LFDISRQQRDEINVGRREESVENEEEEPPNTEEIK
jgi:hypothetical protein